MFWYYVGLVAGFKRKDDTYKTNRKGSVYMALRKYPTIGCCGIDCGLCPRYYTEGTSRCPGCGGEGFEEKHPSCGFITCCEKKHGLNICAECAEFLCKRFEKETGEWDSFVLHRKVMPNQKLIAEKGIEIYKPATRTHIIFKI